MYKRVAAMIFAALAALCSLVPATVLAAPASEALPPGLEIRLEINTPKPKIYDPERDMWQEVGSDGWSRRIDTPQTPPPEGDALWTGVPEGAVCRRCGSALFLDSYRLSNRWLTTSFSRCPRNPNFNDQVQQRVIFQNILCTGEECQLLYDKQLFVEWRTLCKQH